MKYFLYDYFYHRTFFPNLRARCLSGMLAKSKQDVRDKVKAREREKYNDLPRNRETKVCRIRIERPKMKKRGRRSKFRKNYPWRYAEWLEEKKKGKKK